MFRIASLQRAFSLLLILFAFSQGHAQTTFGIIGDAGKAGSDLDKLRQSVSKEALINIIMPGDNLYSGTYPKVWDSWKKSGFDFSITAIGNHNGGYDQEVKYFGLPGEFYSIAKGGARFFVLNSDNTSNIQQQFDFLNKEIVSVKEKLIFIVYHHPTFTMTSSHQWREKKNYQLKMRAFLKQNGQKITGLILGHDHITTLAEYGSIPVILAGSGREARSANAVSFPEDGFQVETRYLAPKVQHFVKMEINLSADEATVQVIRVSDNAKVCTATLGPNSMKLGAGCKM